MYISYNNYKAPKLDLDRSTVVQETEPHEA